MCSYIQVDVTDIETDPRVCFDEHLELLSGQNILIYPPGFWEFHRFLIEMITAF